MPTEKAQRQEVLEVLQGSLRIGKELTDFQQLLKDYFFTSTVFGTLFFFGLQVLLILGVQLYLDYRRKKILLEDDASDNLSLDDVTDSGNSGGDRTGEESEQNPVEESTNEGFQDNNNENLGLDEVTGSNNSRISGLTQDGNDENRAERPIYQDIEDNNNNDCNNKRAGFECNDVFDEENEGDWEDLPIRNTENSLPGSNVVETIPDDDEENRESS